jgi:pyrroline-5-carboxylate reductase
VVVSIAAGVTVEKLLEAAGPEAHVVRVMPNTPCLVGETAAAMCVGGKVRGPRGGARGGVVRGPRVARG